MEPHKAKWRGRPVRSGRIQASNPATGVTLLFGKRVRRRLALQSIEQARFRGARIGAKQQLRVRFTQFLFTLVLENLTPECVSTADMGGACRHRASPLPAAGEMRRQGCRSARRVDSGRSGSARGAKCSPRGIEAGRASRRNPPGRWSGRLADGAGWLRDAGTVELGACAWRTGPATDVERTRTAARPHRPDLIEADPPPVGRARSGPRSSERAVVGDVAACAV